MTRNNVMVAYGVIAGLIIGFTLGFVTGIGAL